MIYSSLYLYVLIYVYNHLEKANTKFGSETKAERSKNSKSLMLMLPQNDCELLSKILT